MLDIGITPLQDALFGQGKYRYNVFMYMAKSMLVIALLLELIGEWRS
jgi:hypothetical protein